MNQFQFLIDGPVHDSAVYTFQNVVGGIIDLIRIVVTGVCLIMLTVLAIKYFSNTPTIKNESKDLIFSVSDNGCGIPNEDIPNMFQRFSQGTSKKRSAGTGLGLYLSRQIIETHGGKIWLESKINKGSEFSFILTDVINLGSKVL